MSTPIFPPEKMDQLLGLLVPDDVRKEGGGKLQERLRNMFDVAARIGHQQRAKEIACAREEGYEAGRQEGWRECQARPHSEASTAWSRANSVSAVTETETHSPSPLSRSLCAVGTQTDAVTVPASPVPLNWAEDAEALPIPSPHPPLTPPTPRDFSALCTGISRPFASLQRRRRRPPRSPSSWTQSRPFFSQHAKSTDYYHYPQKNTPHSHSPFRFTAPSNSFPSGPMPTQLDWDRDPRLRDLGRALAALGWVRP
ncbi:hypothetical protein B0H14DRAFT_2870138 [Mycena olivaceomarginata]|nr:hypothetical protein B0H14DRAFT_2870138 [Mycena olivaceomarginata]